MELEELIAALVKEFYTNNRQEPSISRSCFIRLIPSIFFT